MSKKDKDKDKKAKKGAKKAEQKRSRKEKKKEKAAFALKMRCCTCCGKRCPLTKPKCGKGRALAKALKKKAKARA